MNLFNFLKIKVLVHFAAIIHLASSHCKSAYEPIANLSSALIAFDSVLIAWDEPTIASSCKNSYRVSYCTDISNNCTTSTTRVNYLTIQRQEVCATYKINVTVFSTENTEYSYIRSAKYSSLPISSAVRNLKTAQVQSEKLELIWTYYHCTQKEKIQSFSMTIENQTFGNHSNYSFIFNKNLTKNKTTYNYIMPGLLPYNHYNFTLKAMTDTNQSSYLSESVLVTTDSKVPDLPSPEDTIKHLRVTLLKNEPRKVNLTISNDLFPNKNGMILYYSVILYEDNGKIPDVPKRGVKQLNEKWPPELFKWTDMISFRVVEYYQTTPEKWMPFNRTDKEINFVIGTEGNCSRVIDPNYYCNGHLKLATKYNLKLRALTAKEYQDTWHVSFQTISIDDESNILILCSILFVILLIAVAVIMHGVINKNMSWEELKLLHASWKTKDLNFQQLLSRTSGEIAIEYNALSNSNSRSNSLIYTSCDIAMEPKNKPRNRYNDTIPYNYNRVQLTQTSNDYINASFIKFDKEIREYIACQGPMENTCADMWQMILDQDVASIVMLCEASEINKAKCEKYFPNDEEIYVKFGDIKVEKIMLDDNKNRSFTIRNLRVHKGNLKKSIIHFQYHGWPDFGTPEDPSTLMTFCQLVHTKCPEGLIVVHCSAGVGRTGTYIACDILMQLIQNGAKSLNVYKVVEELRKQRKHMVQTQDQYEFVYTCLAYLLMHKQQRSVSLKRKNFIM